MSARRTPSRATPQRAPLPGGAGTLLVEYGDEEEEPPRARVHPADMTELRLLPDDAITVFAAPVLASAGEEVAAALDALWSGTVWPMKRSAQRGRVVLPVVVAISAAASATAATASATVRPCLAAGVPWPVARTLFVRYDAAGASAAARRGAAPTPPPAAMQRVADRLHGSLFVPGSDYRCRVADVGYVVRAVAAAAAAAAAVAAAGGDGPSHVRVDAAATRIRGCAASADVDDDTHHATTIATPPPPPPPVLIGGLVAQLELLAEMAGTALRAPGGGSDAYAAYGLRPPTGALLSGPPGTGKTLLARALARRLGARLRIINGPEVLRGRVGESEARLRAVFDDAIGSESGNDDSDDDEAEAGRVGRAAAGCVIFIDEVDGLCPRRDAGGGEVEARVVATLAALLDGLRQEQGRQSSSLPPRVFVLAATNRATAVDASLRRPGRLDREVHVGVPTAAERVDILGALLAGYPHACSREDVAMAAARCHGFVGADIAALCAEAARAALRRLARDVNDGGTPAPRAALLPADLAAAMRAVQPSALREITVEVPDVSWDDIGGQAAAKERLREAIEWPLAHPEAFEALGIRPPKGVLLYGPPGCSKTMMAKAMATEGRMNFIAVKGPELFSKYVGDSEKAVAETFRRARAAAPCIVFFDEFDALAGSRAADSDAASGGTSVAARVVSQLLTEMDGVAQLRRVIVVAATNRPDLIDAALLRPGRFDRLLYVGLPDADARRRIVQLQLARVPHESGLSEAAAHGELSRALAGYSGAEIVGIFRDAAVRAVAQDGVDPRLRRAHVDAAAAALPRQVTPSMLAFYDRFARGA